MTDIRIIHTHDDGRISIFTPAPKERLETSQGKMTDAEYWEHVYSKLKSNFSWEKDSLEEVKVSEIPEDRYFRYAWRAGFEVDMEHARVIHMNEIRKFRDKRLAELDKRKYGDEFDQERQELRDLPQAFDLEGAKTPEQLKALWPKQLATGETI